MLTVSMARGSVLVSYRCVTNHPQTTEAEKHKYRCAHRSMVSWACSGVYCQLWVAQVALLILNRPSNKCGVSWVQTGLG